MSAGMWAWTILLGLATAAAVLWALSLRRRLVRDEEALRALADELEAGEPGPGSPGEAPALTRLRRSVGARRPEVPATPGDAPGAEVEEVLDRVGAFLEHAVARPLRKGIDGDEAVLRAAAEDALGAVEDLEFFRDEPLPDHREVQSLGGVLQRVTGEYARAWEVIVRLRIPDEPVRARIDPEGFMDAIYLVLHNAGHFGDGEPVEVVLDAERDKARIRVRDTGPGFTAEALSRAWDPFYSTSPSGLGLGLPHARRTLERMGAVLQLRNQEQGGAEVEIVLPRVE